MSTSEPMIISGQDPEATLHKAIVDEIRCILNEAGVKFVVVEKFGLDIGVFIQNDDRKYAKFIELKAYVGGRMNGVGFGNGVGKGPQVDILILPQNEISILNSSVLWLLGLGDEIKPKGSSRFAIFSCTDAQKAAMGKVERGKQNNFKISFLTDRLISWAQAKIELRRFLLDY